MVERASSTGVYVIDSEEDNMVNEFVYLRSTMTADG